MKRKASKHQSVKMEIGEGTIVRGGAFDERYIVAQVEAGLF
jgi:hypothetical protein